MADALASGASDRKIVGVQVPPRPLVGVILPTYQCTIRAAGPMHYRSLRPRTAGGIVCTTILEFRAAKKGGRHELLSDQRNGATLDHTNGRA